MSHDEEDVFEQLRQALIADGHAFPVSEHEVEAMERILEQRGYPEIPAQLQASELAKSITQGMATTLFHSM